jgi:hypothetical protein
VERRPSHPAFGAPFYVGIGVQDRQARHLRMARGRRHFNAGVQEIFDGHFAEGLVPEFRMLAVCPDKEYAGLVEKRAIAVYGRRGIDPGGILCNVASGGQGPDSSIMQLVKGSISESMRERWKDPAKADACARSLAALESTRAHPERLAKAAAHMQALNADEESRARNVAAMKGVKKTLTPEALDQRRNALAVAQSEDSAQARRDGNLRRWQREEFRAKRSTNQAAAWADPEKRERMLAGRSEGIANSWNDPEVRARRIAGIKAAAARKAQHSLIDKET